MCGIAGFLRKTGSDPAEALHTLAAMTRTLVHRGPDGEGLWVDNDGHVGFGHRRLSIIDVSPTGAQPMASSDARFVITYNGEVYNFHDLRTELESLGARFRGTSDTEAIVEGCARWGVEATVRKLNGIFAFAVWDIRERVLWLARDHMGVKPLYWTHTDSGILFGSELKALRADGKFGPELDMDSVGAYFQFNYIPGPNTVYRGVRKLMPGSLLRVPLSGQPVERRYWDVYAAAAAGIVARRNPIGDDDATEALEALLKQAIKAQMMSDVPLGALLSGGIDSSTVTALMQAQSNRPVKTFSIGFTVEDHNEAPFAAAVAKHLGTEHQELYASPEDALATIPHLTEWYDEPFADSSQIPTYLVSKLARRDVTVALSGDGGDEIFGGYPRYARHSRARATVMAIPGFARAPLSTAITAVGGPAWNQALRLLPRRYQTKAGAATVLRFATALRRSDPRAFHQALVSFWEDPSEIVPNAGGVQTDFQRELPPVPMEYMDASQLIDSATYLVDEILCKVDRASMAVSLETRVPILDYSVVEFAWTLPLNMKRRGNTMKWLLRQVLYRHVPPELVERPKKGFAIPLASWLRNELRDWAEELLDSQRLRHTGFLNTNTVERLWREHLSGQMNHSDRLWAVLQFQDWFRRWGGDVRKPDLGARAILKTGVFPGGG